MTRSSVLKSGDPELPGWMAPTLYCTLQRVPERNGAWLSIWTFFGNPLGWLMP